MYPTPAAFLGLNVIDEMKKRYKYKIGYSDHSGSIYPLFASVVKGAEIIEFHITFDKRMFGPDSTSSLTIDETFELVKAIRMIEESLNNKVNKQDTSKFSNVKKIFQKSLAVNKTLKKGSIISFEDLEAKKPFGYGIDAKEYKKVIGKKLKIDKNKWDFLNYKDFE